MVIQESSLSLATQKAQNALKDYFLRVATLSVTDQVDIIGDLKDYVLIVENGIGAVDYKFIVQADGSLSQGEKGNHSKDNWNNVLINANESVLVTAASYNNARAVEANGCANGIDGLNGVAIYATGANTVYAPAA